jgi:basic membrane protein A and related proteins
MNAQRHEVPESDRRPRKSASRIRRIGGLLLTVVAAVAIASCGGDDSSSSSAGGDGGGGGNGDFKVALMSEGAKNDKSFSNSVYDGATRAAKEHGLDMEFVGSLVTPDEFLRQGNSFASSGVDLLMFIHGGMAVQAREVARKFPDVTVCVGPVQPTPEEEQTDPPNICYWDVQQQDGSFMAGALVAMMPGVDHIGSVNAFEFAAITRQAEGFALGARCINPDIEFTQAYVETWTDTDKARAAAQSMISAGVDVILAATDSAVVGIYEAARDAPKPVYVIPSYFDAYEQAPDVILTTILHNLDGAMYDLISQAQGEGLEEHALLDYDFVNGDVGKLAPFRDRKKAIGADNIERWQTEVVDAVKSGDIDIPGTMTSDPPLGSVGSGTKLDPTEFGCKA